MKKILVFFLCLVMGAALIPAASADDYVTFDSKMANILDYSADEWMSTDLNRAMFAVMIALDLSMNEAPYEMSELADGYAYVGRAKNLMIFVYTAPNSDQAVYVMYDTLHVQASGQAAYAIIDMDKTYMKDFLEEAFSKTCTDGFYRVESDSLLLAMKILTEALSK